MYRIVQARSGYYYVQTRNSWGLWKKCSPFFYRRWQARDWARWEPARQRMELSAPRVVEYI